MRNVRRAALPVALALTAALTGCSSGAAPEDASAPADDEAADDAAAPDAAGRPADALSGRDPGVSGLVAAVSGVVAQVQDADSQTAVTWDDATVFRRTTTAGLDAVTVGSCVVAVLPGEDSDDTAATSVTVTEAVDGECSVRPGGPQAGSAGTPPEGELPALPDGDLPAPPDGAPAEAEGFGAIVAGRVTAVDGTTVTVEATGADGTTTSELVETSDGTVVTTTADADASALVVGVCAAVQGEADTSGGMTAASITISDPGDDGCTSPGGFGGFGGFGGAGGMPGGERPGEESADE